MFCSPFSEIEYPNTKLAKAYLAKKEATKHMMTGTRCHYEYAYAEIFAYLVSNIEVLRADASHPHAIQTDALVEQLNKNPPPKSKPELFGFASWKEFAAKMDNNSKGYIMQSDIALFWESFGVRNAFLKNRKAKPIKTLESLMTETLQSILVVAEEALLKDPNNAARVCVLTTKYVGVVTFDLVRMISFLMLDCIGGPITHLLL